MNTDLSAFGATPRLTPTIADPTRRLASLITRATRADNREARNLWGPSCRGLVQGFFTGAGIFTLNPKIRLIRNARGLATGFDADGLKIDYAAMAAATEAARRQGLGLLLAGPNANIARRMPASAEEQLARTLAETVLPETVAEALASMGLEAERVPLRAATRLATGIIAESLTNALPGSRSGHLNLARAFPPSLRLAIAAPLLAGLEADGVRDLLLQLAVAALAPSELASNAGTSPKRILDRLELPREARRVLPRALSPIARWLRLEDRELTGSDLRWLSSELCAALPDRSLEQLQLLDLAFALRLGGAKDVETSIWGTWAARNLEVLKAEGLRDWLLAPHDLLDRLALPAWRAGISAERAIDAAEALAQALAAMADPHRGVPFRLPGWAVPAKLPSSDWHMVPLTDELELAAEGRRMSNCVGSYTHRCYGGTVILSLRRKPTAQDSRRFPRLPDGMLIGANAELVHYADAWQCVQIKGPANSDPPTSAAAALQRFLDAINLA